MRYIRIEKDCESFREGTLLTDREAVKYGKESYHQWLDIKKYGKSYEASKRNIYFFFGCRFEYKD